MSLPSLNWLQTLLGFFDLFIGVQTNDNWLGDTINHPTPRCLEIQSLMASLVLFLLEVKAIKAITRLGPGMFRAYPA
jgi:hypothetical protein